MAPSITLRETPGDKSTLRELADILPSRVEHTEGSNRPARNPGGRSPWLSSVRTAVARMVRSAAPAQRRRAPRNEPVVIIGAGGHASVVIDAIQKQGQLAIFGIIDDLPQQRGQEVLGYPILGGREVLTDVSVPRRAVIAIGSTDAREAWMSYLVDLGFELPTVLHPSAQIGSGVSIGCGTVLLAGSIVSSRSRLGRCVIVNTGASVDHDCLIGDLVHIAPGAHLAGGVHVGRRSHIGIGASVVQRIEIGSEVILGAGAAAIDSIPSGTTAVGVPARVVSRHSNDATALQSVAIRSSDSA